MRQRWRRNAGSERRERLLVRTHTCKAQKMTSQNSGPERDPSANFWNCTKLLIANLAGSFLSFSKTELARSVMGTMARERRRLG